MVHIIPNKSSCIIYKKSDCEKIFGEFGLRTRAGNSKKIIKTRPSHKEQTPEMSPACP